MLKPVLLVLQVVGSSLDECPKSQTSYGPAVICDEGRVEHAQRYRIPKPSDDSRAGMASAAISPPADPTPSNLTFRLYFESADASANHDCPSPRQKRYAADFSRRYGMRIDRLMKIHIARSGPDPDFAVISSCRMSRATLADQDDDHRRAMDAFDARLRALEREFGGY